MQLSTADYLAAAHHLLQQADTEIQLGDLRQASGKAWGGAAHHRSLKRIARGLAQTTGNPDFLVLFNAVEQLHVNFYDNTRSAAAVQAGIQDATGYVALAETELPATA